MTEAILALAGGLIVGAIFGFVKLPLPAPPTLPGILGAVGMFIGYQLLRLWKN
jgi:XapX domain-containing protein